MMRWVCGVLVVTGCSFSGPASHTSPLPDGGAADGLPRTCQWSYTPAHFDPCNLDFAPAPVFEAQAAYVVDTDESVLIGPDGAEPIELNDEGQGDGVVMAIWAVVDFDFTGATLRVEGASALVIASDNELIVRGDIDLVGGGDKPAAGADHVTACGPVDLPIRGSTGVGAGGGGGAGAATSSGAAGQASTSGAGGAAGAKLSVLTIRGGCSGGASGTDGAAGGPGGGGIHLAARTLVRIDADVNAGGGGGLPGGGAAVAAGGGGGGSGGTISLEAPRVELSSVTRLAANGGGGGSGSSAGGIAGESGQAGRIDGMVAAGGIPPVGGQPGGSGGAGAIPPTTTPGAAVAGGGGGGAPGRIVVRAAAFDNLAPVVSPAPQLPPLE